MSQKKPKTDVLPPLRLEWRSPAELADNPRNWRTHPDAQVTALADVIAEVGWAGACLYNERTNRLIDGHARRKIALDQGCQKIPVLVGSWDEATEAKILATPDPISAMAEADSAKLEALLREVSTDSDSIQQRLDDLATQAGTSLLSEGRTDPDAIPEQPDERITQPGDLWLLGKHRLLCGDSSKPEDVDRLLDGAAIHLVNADPPYNVKVEPRSNNAIAAGLNSFEATHHQKLDVERHPEKAQPTTKKLRAKDRPLANDFVSDEEFDRFLQAWFGNLARVLLPGRCFYIWGGYANCSNYPPVLKATGLYFSQAIIWDKQHPVLTRKDYMGAHEWCFYGWREGAGDQFFGPNNATDLWAIKKVNPQSMIHLTEKPVELAARAMEYSAYVKLGRDRQGVLYCEADLQRRDSERIVADGVEHVREFRPDGFAIETNLFQQLFVAAFSRVGREQQVHLPIHTIDNQVNKQVRIRRIGPFLAQRQLRFKARSSGTLLLVQQLKDFPVGDHDDGPDALEAAIRIAIEIWNGRHTPRPPERLRV